MNKVFYEDLKGKKVVITGGSSGIGLECVKAFLNQGALVLAQYKKTKNLWKN